MKSVSEEIYDYYKSLDEFQLALGKNGKWIKWIFWGYIFSGIYVLSAEKNYGYFVILTLVPMTLMILLVDRKILKKNKGKRSEIEHRFKSFGLRSIKAYLLQEKIRERGLFNKEGLDYLIGIFLEKKKERQVSKIAIGAIAMSSIITCGINLIFFGTIDNFNRLFEIIDFININKEMILSIGIVVMFLYAFKVKFLKLNTMDMKSTIFPQNYESLVDLLKIYMLPLSIIDTNNCSLKFIEDNIEYKNIEAEEERISIPEEAYGIKDFRKELNHCFKMKEKKMISNREYKRLKNKLIEKTYN